MKMIKSTLLLILIGIIIAFGGCKPENNIASVQIDFTRDNFNEQKNLNNPDIINLPNVLNPASFYLLQDSIIIVQNQPNVDYLLEIYSINNLNDPIIELVPQGNGPEEMLSCYGFIKTNTQSTFYLEDGRKKCYYTVNIDSILKNKKLQFYDSLYYNPNKHPLSEICKLNDSNYITYNMWYLESSQFDNNVPKLEINSIGKIANEINIEDKKYFVSAINGSHLFKNPSSQEIWVADIHQDKIMIYDDSLNIKKILCGPDHFQPKYVRKESNAPFSFIGFDNDKDYRAYSNFFITDKYIYLLYEGTDKFNPDHLQSVEVFKLDFNGNLICNYKLDRYLYTISIDKAGKYLYGSSRNSLQGESVFVRYQL